MNSVALASLPAAGFLLLTMGAPVFAQEGCEHKGTSVSSLVNMVMTEDKTALVDSLATLESDLESARDALDSAELSVSETKFDGASALLAGLKTEQAIDEGKIVFERAMREVKGAQAELKDLRSLPKSQETSSDIAFIEAELVTLRRFAAGAENDFLQAMQRMKSAQIKADTTEVLVGRAEDKFLLEKRELDAVHERINTAHSAFDAEREAVETVLVALSQEQRTALSRSLDGAVNNDFMTVDIDAKHLRTIHDEDYTVRQVQYLAQALKAEAEYKQIAEATGDRKILDMAAREKDRFMAEIDRLEAEKYDAGQGGKSVFGIASHPGGKKR
jgi:hypothetical protein